MTLNYYNKKEIKKMFDYYLPDTKHWYSLAATGIKFKDKEFSSRQVAEDTMYKFMVKNGLYVQKIWDDKHYKTYICNNGVRFYINRI